MCVEVLINIPHVYLALGNNPRFNFNSNIMRTQMIEVIDIADVRPTSDGKAAFATVTFKDPENPFSRVLKRNVFASDEQTLHAMLGAADIGTKVAGELCFGVPCAPYEINEENYSTCSFVKFGNETLEGALRFAGKKPVGVEMDLEPTL